MLKKSFIHLPGIGKESEASLWKKGVLEWDDVFSNNEVCLRVKEEVMKSIIEYGKENLSYFAESLPKNEHWRVYEQLKNKCCFLDIETSGLNKEDDIITVIGLYDGKESKIFVHGKNMGQFTKEIAKYDMVVTFNGACFDLPYIRKKISNAKLPNFHVDLRYAMKNIGYVGGLKKIERELGHNRDASIADVDGFEAVRLWKAYTKGDKSALNKLIEYNKADIENLKPLMEFAYEKLCEKTFVYH